MKSFRKPMERKQGLKLLIYGKDGVGKSQLALTFPNIAYIDTESKIGTYENNSAYNKNLLGIMDTNNYFEVCKGFEEIIASKNSNGVQTIVIDSETNLYETMQVVMMEIEENRAKIKAERTNKSLENAINDSVISQRGYGKIRLNHNRLKNHKINASINGINVIVIAHQKDIYNDQVKIGEEPELRQGSKHDYDIIVKSVVQKNIGSGKNEYVVIVEKDTTGTFKLNETIDVTWDGETVSSIFYDKLKLAIKTTGEEINNYKTIDNLIEEVAETDSEIKNINFQSLVNNFQDVYRKLNEENQNEIKAIMKDKKLNLKNIDYADEIKEVLEYMNTLLKQ